MQLCDLLLGDFGTLLIDLGSESALSHYIPFLLSSLG